MPGKLHSASINQRSSWGPWLKSRTNSFLPSFVTTTDCTCRVTKRIRSGMESFCQNASSDLTCQTSVGDDANIKTTPATDGQAVRAFS